MLLRRKSYLALFGFAVYVVGSVFMFSSDVEGAITGSAHDFSSQGWSGGEICITCHTPHSSQTVANAPLWNHTLTTASFTVYSSTTLNATVGQPSGRSKLCLSCHDGSVAVDSYGGATGTNFVTGDALVGTNLSNDHPVSFTYDAALATADGGLKNPATTNSGLGSTIAADMLFGGQLECSSCHDVHNGPNINYLLLKSNAASALCLTCHSK